MAGRPPAAASPRRLGLEAAIVLAAAALVCAWFASGSWPAAVVTAAALVAAAVLRLREGGPPRPARPHLETTACLAIAVAYRFPALLHPWGWVNRDGAYGAFVALHLLQGVRPAPVFTEGANYQGTLKGHLAALVGLLTGSRDLSWLMVVASLALYLVFVAASMALARRLAGRAAGCAAGLYLALGPRFLTVFSVNCVGQYVDVLALGGVALALLARVLDEDRHGAAARRAYLAVGALLGAAFWQQPVALCYVAAAAVALVLRRRTWQDRWTLLVPAGLVLGALPVLLWNAQHDWASADILGREPAELKAQADALPRQVRRAAQISFPILAGMSPGHPWADSAAASTLAMLVIPAALAAFLLLRGRAIVLDLRARGASASLLPPVLLAACLALFWAIASGRVYWRPRYLLPVVAATAVHLGVALAWLWARQRLTAAAALAALLALNVAGTLDRLRESAGIAGYYAQVVRSLREKGVRTGYADFSLSAPVTMFTAEEIVLSSRLGPTPAYESEAHRRRVERDGPDAYVLRPEDDADAFAATLRGLGVGFALDRKPVTVFHAFTRRVPLAEVVGAGRGVESTPSEE
jgi:dolichyl-phosphate-mannose-protein mannosyltransferase